MATKQFTPKAPDCFVAPPRTKLKQLSPEHREIVDLVYYHDKTIEEVADIIQVPKNTVKTRMFYARKRLAQLLAVHKDFDHLTVVA
jgi:DNA-directed RNA polymerase specialized sigma24 family protein